jgi:hypothetical protein
MRKRSMKGHDLDPFSLVLGTVFALIGSAFLMVHIDPAELRLERVWPVPLIGLGLLIVLLAAVSPRPAASDGERPVDPAEPAEPAPETSAATHAAEDAGSFFPPA